MNRSKFGALLSAVAMILAGILLFLNPGGTLNTAIRILGVALLVYGAGHVLVYVLQDGDDRSVMRMGLGLVVAIVGIVFIANPAFIVSIFPILAGLLIAVSGVENLLMALRVKETGDDSWKLLSLLSVLTIAFGVLIFANPFSTMNTLLRVLAMILLYDGVVGVISATKV